MSMAQVYYDRPCNFRVYFIVLKNEPVSSDPDYPLETVDDFINEVREYYVEDNKYNYKCSVECSGDYTDDTVTVIHDRRDKLDFLISNSCKFRYETQSDADAAAQDIVNVLKEYIPEITGIIFDTVTSVNIPESNYAQVLSDSDEDEPLVDTGATLKYDPNREWFKNNHVTVKEFIMSNRYAIIIENKCNNFVRNLIRAGHLNADSIENYGEICKVAE